MTQPDQQRQRPIAIWGAYGGMNIGDEAILASLTTLLRARQLEPTTLIVQNPPEPEVTSSYRELGLEPVAFRNIFGLLRSLRRSDLVCGGGQLMDDCGRIGFPVGFTSILILVNRLMGGRPVLLGIGAEPVNRGLTKWLVRRMYAIARTAMVRDTSSSDALTAAGYPAHRVTVGGDLALGLSGLRDEAAPQPKRLLVVPNRDSRRVSDTGGLFDRIVETARTAGWKVTVMAHDRRMEYDAGELARMAESVGTDNIDYVVPSSLEDALTHYRAAEVVISARMHPLMLALLHGIVPIAIPVVTKVDTLASDLSLPTLAVDSPAEEIAERLTATQAMSVASIEPILAQRRNDIAQHFDTVVQLWHAPSRALRLSRP